MFAVVATLALAAACSAATPGGSPGQASNPTTLAGQAPSPSATIAAPASAPATPTSVASPAAAWPVSPEPLPSAMSGAAERLTCGGSTFSRSALGAPTDAARASGPQYDALRATLAQFADAFPGASGWPWQLVAEDASGATFLARTDALGSPGWVTAEVSHAGGTWKPRSIGQCHLSVVIAPDLGPARWALDPAYPAPGPTSTELHVLVWELSCNGGTPLTGRIGPPVIDYGATTVTITLGVRPLGGIQTCPGTRGTPATIRLPQPLGPRTLLDGGTFPPAAPSPMF